jgi:hypothetical protein
MNVGKPGVIALGVVTALPLAWMGVFFVGFFALFFTTFSNAAAQSHSVEPPFLFAFMFLGHLFIMLLVLALLVVYIVHLFRTDLIGSDKKALWAVVLFLGNVFAMPVYWFLYMWRPLRGQQRPLPGSHGAA